MESLSVLLFGFLLGMRHAADADHVVAVTTIVSQEQRLSRACFIGMFWGLGHTLTILLAGSAIIIFNLVIPARMGLFMEFCVGAMITALGAIRLRKIVSPGAPAPSIAAQPFLIGLVHGLAGSAAVALLLLPLIPSAAWAAVYLMIFGLGTMVGMMAVTLLISIPYLYANGLQTFHRYLGIATAAASILFGLHMMYELGIENGLFTDQPVWTPE
jgi:high-affinity nickel-transport protein